LNLLTNIEPELCKNYIYQTFDDWAQMPSAMIMRKERRSMLKSMNVIVAERMSFVDDYIQSILLKEKCREYLLPVYTPNPIYSPLKLAKFSGQFAFLFLFLCLTFFIFTLELLVVKWKKPLRKTIIIQYDKRIPFDTQNLILVKIAKMKELAARKTVPESNSDSLLSFHF
jgi:hypothetical protein